MASPGYRRRKILVDKRLQLGISLKVVMWLTTYLVLFCLMSVTAPLLTALATNGGDFLFGEAMRELATFGKRLVLPLGLTFLALALHCALLMHKIAGPLYRVKMMLRGVGNGNLADDMRLRQGDELNDVADAFNDMVGSLREDLSQLKEHTDALVTLGKGVDPQGNAKLEEMIEHGHALQSLLDSYEVVRERKPDQAAPAEDQAAAEADAEAEAKAS